MKVIPSLSETAATCDSCGCSGESDTALTIVCSLGVGDFRQRILDIHALSEKHLLAVSREPLQIDLTYAPEAWGAVQDLVAKESECCSFLEFSLRQDADAVRLSILAPESAAFAADELFGHFQPDQIAQLAGGQP